MTIHQEKKKNEILITSINGIGHEATIITIQKVDKYGRHLTFNVLKNETNKLAITKEWKTW